MGLWENSVVCVPSAFWKVRSPARRRAGSSLLVLASNPCTGRAGAAATWVGFGLGGGTGSSGRNGYLERSVCGLTWLPAEVTTSCSLPAADPQRCSGAGCA